MLALKELLDECQIGASSLSTPAEEPSSSSVAASSSSTAAAEQLLAPAAPPHRALIFCQWRASLELIADYLTSGAFGAEISFLRLDGSVPVGERQALVDRFNTDTDVDVLLLTTHVCQRFCVKQNSANRTEQILAITI